MIYTCGLNIGHCLFEIEIESGEKKREKRKSADEELKKKIEENST